MALPYDYILILEAKDIARYSSPYPHEYIYIKDLNHDVKLKVIHDENIKDLALRFRVSEREVRAWFNLGRDYDYKYDQTAEDLEELPHYEIEKEYPDREIDEHYYENLAKESPLLFQSAISGLNQEQAIAVANNLELLDENENPIEFRSRRAAIRAIQNANLSDDYLAEIYNRYMPRWETNYTYDVRIPIDEMFSERHRGLRLHSLYFGDEDDAYGEGQTDELGFNYLDHIRLSFALSLTLSDERRRIKQIVLERTEEAEEEKTFDFTNQKIKADDKSIKSFDWIMSVQYKGFWQGILDVEKLDSLLAQNLTYEIRRGKDKGEMKEASYLNNYWIDAYMTEHYSPDWAAMNPGRGGWVFRLNVRYYSNYGKDTKKKGKE